MTNDTTPTDHFASAAPMGCGADPVSFSLGLYRCVGDPELHMRLLVRFLTTRLSLPEEVRRAWLDGDVEEAARVVHSAISTAGSIGAIPLADAARALHVAIHRSPVSIEARLEAFASEHARVVAALRQYVTR